MLYLSIADALFLWIRHRSFIEDNEIDSSSTYDMHCIITMQLDVASLSISGKPRIAPAEYVETSTDNLDSALNFLTSTDPCTIMKARSSVYR